MKQYQKLFAMDNDGIRVWTSNASSSTAKAIERRTGAVVLSIIESVMMDLMFEIQVVKIKVGRYRSYCEQELAWRPDFVWWRRESIDF